MNKLKYIVFFLAFLVNHNLIIAADDIDNLLRQAESGNADIQYHLVKIYGQGIGVERDSVKAKYWLLKAAENGQAEAEYWMGYNYFYGYDIERNRGKALQWYEKSAKQDYGPAQFMTGYIYQKGSLIDENIRTDFSKALYWYQRASAKDEKGALFHLGCFKYFGIAIASNIPEAMELILKAANMGQNGAKSFIKSKNSVTDGKLRQMCDIYT